ncbi:hypothetical protein FSP39_024002 [Pinctada imbricata]|uniref:Carboxylic ester hydrolase n=1 Tax=Pinctada imbricata TaxID=66713 RepID=A0AA88YAN3_PINIB|nr:hypothetical protein FSP39_024002 [Pinctada imbricata]
MMDGGIFELTLQLTFAILSFVHVSGTIVKTEKGRVRGFHQRVRGESLDVFYGIPFAKPPIGDLRFKHPIPPDPWTGVYDATHLPNACYQHPDTMFVNHSGAEMWNPNTLASEDCLYLNIWVPRTKTRDKAVMIWIYGGSYSFGSASLDVYNGAILAASNDVIVVSMNYRVGSLGFLAADTPEAPGNCGLFDQLMAMDWVQTNIHSFGGSPYNVTLFGESAGAASIGLHLVSPLSRLKFNRAILQSAGPQAPWAVISKSQAFDRSRELGKRFNCVSSDPTTLIRCLRSRNVTDFPTKDFDTITVGITQFPFVPIVDGSFLVSHPMDALETGNFKKVPLLLGTNKHEGTYFLIYGLPYVFKITDDSLITEERFRMVMRTFFNYYPQYPKVINPFVMDAIIHFYTPWINSKNESLLRDRVGDSIGDLNFVCPTVNFAEYYARENLDVYFYEFNHEYTTNPWPDWMGVMHGDEIMFVFGEPLNNSKGYTHEERKLSKKMMEFWSNFAKTGNPNKSPGKSRSTEWPLHTHTERLYLSLDTTYLQRQDKRMSIGVGPKIEECAFWRHYIPKLDVQTADISETEKEWKQHFADWKNVYMVDWKLKYDMFLQNYEKQLQSCSFP